MPRVVGQRFAPRIADLPTNHDRSVRAIADAMTLAQTSSCCQSS
jgi:hypothetical protein